MKRFTLGKDAISATVPLRSFMAMAASHIRSNERFLAFNSTNACTSGYASEHAAGFAVDHGEWPCFYGLRPMATHCLSPNSRGLITTIDELND
ncbi:hypothetical protein PT974_07316 [Cladobotryum mycophilum]|uniref:Uncharacterized protein n=1 Tax=Cladobotryum mycophilum TaxID=491253 RepID=A0ABR0SNY0_9HYPO